MVSGFCYVRPRDAADRSDCAACDGSRSDAHGDHAGASEESCYPAHEEEIMNTWNVGEA